LVPSDNRAAVDERLLGAASSVIAVEVADKNSFSAIGRLVTARLDETMPTRQCAVLVLGFLRQLILTLWRVRMVRHGLPATMAIIRTP